MRSSAIRLSFFSFVSARVSAICSRSTFTCSTLALFRSIASISSRFARPATLSSTCWWNTASIAFLRSSCNCLSRTCSFRSASASSSRRFHRNLRRSSCWRLHKDAKQYLPREQTPCSLSASYANTTVNINGIEGRPQINEYLWPAREYIIATVRRKFREKKRTERSFAYDCSDHADGIYNYC